MSSPIDRQFPTSHAIARLLCIVTSAAACCRIHVDPDLWGHLRFGLDMLGTRHLSSIDPYSFTQDKLWINHEWLSEAIFALAYRQLGVAGVVLLKAALIAGVLALVVVALRTVPPPARWWALAIAAVVMIPMATLRPQLWTFVAVALLPRVLRLDGMRQTVALLVLFAAWANFHGGWIVGVALLGAWLIGRWLDDPERRTVRYLAVPVCAALAGTLVNPYGWRLWAFVVETVRLTRDITEWQPVWRQDDYRATMVLWAVASIFAVATVCRRPTSWSVRLPTLMLAILGWQVARISPIFGVLTAVLMGPAWRSRKPDAPRATPRFAIRVVETVAAAFVGILMLPIEGRALCMAIPGDWAPDIGAASALLAAQPGRLVVSFNWGEYAIWHFSPVGLRVSIDGRRETVYSERVIAEQTAIGRGDQRAFGVLERERPEYVWLQLPAASRTAEWLPQHGYRIDVKTARSFVAARVDRPALTPAPSMPRCFP